MKQIIALVLAVLITLSLVACGEKEALPSETPGLQQTESSTQSSEGAEESSLPSESVESEPTEPPIKTVYIKTSEKTYIDGELTYAYEYDSRGNLLKSVDGAAGVVGGYICEYTYDENNNCLSKIYTENGFPSSYTYYTYDAVGNMLTKDVKNAQSELHYTYRYNDKNQKIEEVFSGAAGVESITEFSYNSAGLLARAATRRGTKTEPEDIIEYTYDARGNKLTENQYSNGLLVELVWTYDDADRMLTSFGYVNIGEERILKEAMRWAYDDHGNQIMACFNPDPNATIQPEWQYTYDAAGNILSRSCWQKDGSYALEYANTYDVAGKQEKTIYYNTDGSVRSTSVYAYDETGNLLNVIGQSPDGSSAGKTEYTYDEAGNVLSRTIYSKDGSVSQKDEYTYIAIEIPNE